MTLEDLLRCFFSCILTKGSWSPNTNSKKKDTRRHRMIIKKRLKEKPFRRKKKRIPKKDVLKPDWLKQWTISKGWMHNRSHLLNLGVDNTQVMENEQQEENSDKSFKTFVEDWIDSGSVQERQRTEKELAWLKRERERLEENLEENSESDSSVSIENIDDLISIVSSNEISGKYTPDFKSGEIDKIEILEEPISKTSIIMARNTDEISMIFEQISQNYRRNFPDSGLRLMESSDISLPEVYRERLLKNERKFTILNFFKQFKKKKKSHWKNYKFTVNELYDSNWKKEEFYNDSENYNFINEEIFSDDCIEIGSPLFKDYLENNKTKHNKKLQRSSLGKNIALYNTLNSKTNLHEEPIYECSEDEVSIYNNPIYEPLAYFHCKEAFYDFRKKFYKGDDQLKKNIKQEKYIIRHVRIRIMLSLRLGKLQKLYKKRRKPCYKKLLGVNHNSCTGIACESSAETRYFCRKAHEEQRRIGNGETSLKIQNMRYGKLNVLHWLLWEARNKSGMPALERASNTTLALHYAAARGCLDCVRLLVDSSPELSANTQMDNDVTPVYLAAQEGHLDVLKFLVLEAGGSLYVRAKDGMAPIHAASQMGCLNCVKWMIQEQGVDPNLRDGDGATPLHFAASRGHLDTVRWLLKHGARLSLDKYGKSPINDAAENQQVECLNVLVQHGTTPDYGDTNRKRCSCMRKTEQSKRNSISSDCSGCKPSQNGGNNGSNQEPFYLHPPLGSRPLEAAHAPQDGLYVNPMNSHRHSISSGSDISSSGESFYLHNPQEVIYNRVKDLFGTTQNHKHANSTQQQMSALTVKVEVHSSSSGAGSDENLSSSDLSERSEDHDHEYEDIYTVREETNRNKERNGGTNRSRSRDSGSHSRSGSMSSSNSGCNVIVKLTQNKDTNVDLKKGNEFLPKPQKYENFEKIKNMKKEYSESGLSSTPSTLSSEDDSEKMKLNSRHSLPHNHQGNGGNGRNLKRVTSMPEGSCPPPPPPPFPASNVRQEDEPRGAEVVEVVEEPTVRPSDVVKGMCRSISAISSRRLNSSCSDLTIITLSNDADTSKSTLSHLVNKQRVLPFIPPSFPGSADSNNLIKPSEYLRSISDKRSSISSDRSVSDYDIVNLEKENYQSRPPPPPLPEFNDNLHVSKTSSESNTGTATKQLQPLAAISIQDLNSVQLKRTEKTVASKTFSAPTRSMSLQCLQSEPYLAQKIDLIAELKMSKDITGIKKMKIERSRAEEKQEKEIYVEISKQFTASNFVEKIPDKDNTGNLIPPWKRQMLAKKAAEKARKELEEQLLREAEEKRLQAIPQWKRQLLAKKEETENKIKQTIYTPKVEESKTKVQSLCIKHQENENKEDCNNNEVNNEFERKENDESMSSVKAEMQKSEPEEQNIIPWRAQLRKTNSKLNLLE